MPLSQSILAYIDCTDVLDRALESKYGIRVTLPNMTAAMHFRDRVHQARVLHRRENAKIYEPGHMMHGRSEYDVLRVRLRTGGHNGTVYMNLEKIEQFAPTEITDLPPPTPDDWLPKEPPKEPPLKPTEMIIQPLIRRRI